MRVIDTRVSVPFDQRIKDADAPTDTDAQIAARADELSRTIGDNEARRDNGNTLVNEPTRHVPVTAEDVVRHANAVWLRMAQPWALAPSIEVETSAVAGKALVWLWKADDAGKLNVLDYFRVTSQELRSFAAQLVNLSIVIDAADQAALEADCDRREEIQRLGHES